MAVRIQLTYFGVQSQIFNENNYMYKELPNITNQNSGHVEFVVTVFSISFISIENLLFDHKICSLYMMIVKPVFVITVFDCINGLSDTMNIFWRPITDFQ